MKNTAIILLAITTLVLVMLTVMSALDFPFPWIFYLTCGGQLLLLVTIYKVLTDDYSTDKNFEDWYEDCPVESRKQP